MLNVTTIWTALAILCLNRSLLSTGVNFIIWPILVLPNQR
jgi:hypothetical protein